MNKVIIIVATLYSCLSLADYRYCMIAVETGGKRIRTSYRLFCNNEIQGKHLSSKEVDKFIESDNFYRVNLASHIFLTTNSQWADAEFYCLNKTEKGSMRGSSEYSTSSCTDGTVLKTEIANKNYALNKYGIDVESGLKIDGYLPHTGYTTSTGVFVFKSKNQKR